MVGFDVVESPSWGKLRFGSVVSSQSVNSGLDENHSEFGICCLERFSSVFVGGSISILRGSRSALSACSGVQC
jgi:hypothetical protein